MQETGKKAMVTSGTIAEDVAAIGRIGAVQKILEVICGTTGMGFSAVARVTDQKWVAGAVRDEISFGLKPGSELDLQTTICNEIRLSNQTVVIDHVAQDTRFCNHHTPRQYGFQSYISTPINMPDGRFFGTLCAIDPRPAKVNTPEIVQMFNLFADLIGMHLDTQERVAASHAALLDARETAVLREQFIAVLGHDLRNPLSAIVSGTQLLQMLPHDEETAEVLALMDRGAKRMAGLINDVLDFARGRLGEGLTISPAVDGRLELAINQVTSELQTAWPKRIFHRHIEITRPVRCDSTRIAQMLSNLLANALTHGDPASPVWIDATTSAGGFELSVTNRGETIPPEIMAKLFQPFSRGSVRTRQEGLGLGLYISSEIARAHEGTLSVESRDSQTRFTFRIPTA